VLNRAAEAIAESYDNGRPIRGTRAADIPLAADHFRYFASVIRGQDGAISEIDKDTIAYHFHEPLGVVGQIIPFNVPLLMAAWKMAPALAAGNCTVVKPHRRDRTGRLIMQYAAQNLIPSTTELGGKSPNIFFADVMAQDDAFLDKVVEGFVLYAFNKWEVWTRRRCSGRRSRHRRWRRSRAIATSGWRRAPSC
jgi:aldehyde dehydrogenase